MSENAILELVDREAEKATIAACLTDGDLVVDVADIVKPDDFFVNGHKHIYEAMLDLFEADKPVDIMTVQDAIRAHTSLENVGTGQIRGLTYLTSLVADGGFHTYNARTYAETVRELAQRRKVVLGCKTTVKDALDRSVEVTEVIERGTSLILDASANGAHALRPMGEDFDAYSEDLLERVKDPEKRNPGIDTGFTDIDKMTSGLEQSKLWIIAGRPGMGKTGWLVSLTCNLSVNDEYRAAIFSLEMSREELYSRMLAYLTRIDLQRLAKGDITAEEVEKVDDATARLRAAKDRIWIDDTPGLTPTQIRARASQMAMRPGGIDYLWIDYVQLINVPESKGSNYVQATVASREAKNLAKHLHVPVLAASQLSRKVEERKPPRPQLSDLRDSGGIEEAADLVGFLYREEYYAHRDNREATRVNEGDFMIAKHRNGPDGMDIPLYFEKKCAAYRNIAHREHIELNRQYKRD